MKMARSAFFPYPNHRKRTELISAHPGSCFFDVVFSSDFPPVLSPLGKLRVRCCKNSNGALSGQLRLERLCLRTECATLREGGHRLFVIRMFGRGAHPTHFLHDLA